MTWPGEREHARHSHEREEPLPNRAFSAALFTISDVADSLSVSNRTVRRWIDRRLLIAHRIGGTIRIAEADLKANCDVPGRSPQKPWPGSSPSAKTSSDNHH